MNDNSENPFNYNVLFRKDTKGRTVFYPWGGLGNGYLVPDTSIEKDITNFLMFYSGITTALIAGGIVLSQENTKWLFIFSLLPIIVLWYRIKIAKLTRGLEIVKVDSEYHSPPSIDKRYRGLCATILVLGVLGGLGNIFNNGFSVADLLLVVGSGICLVLFGYVSWIRK